MCGITAIYAYRPDAQTVDAAELAAISEHMAARGPDGSGLWLSADQKTGLAHRRLAIIDLSEAAAQPMASADGQVLITFNGEIYNYRQLRSELSAQGCQFRTHSDTEVLLHLYAHKQQHMVQDLQGMFAFAIWDARRQTLLLARDPYGIKPLYYADHNGTLRVASQVKALLAGGRIPAARDATGIAGFFLTGSVPEPHTTLAAIQALPAGSTLQITPAGPQPPQQYFSIASIWARAEPPPGPADQAQHCIRAAVQQSVARHLVADVPVAVFLSAGIDSAALLGVIRDVAPTLPVHTLTLAFADYAGSANDEAPLAARVARHYHCSHSIRHVAAAEFHQDLPRILAAMDQPSIDGINAWFISKACRELGLKVAISGLGGDELFGGYPSFTDIPRWNRWLRWPAKVPGLAWLFEALTAPFVASDKRKGLNPKFPGLLRYGATVAGAWLLRRGLFMPWELGLAGPANPLQWINQALADGPRSTQAQVATLESVLYMRNQLLRDADWAGMAHGVEIRLPLVDATLLTQIAPLLLQPARHQNKLWLARCPLTPLPDEVVQRTKTGFTTPIRHWLQQAQPSSAGNPAATPPLGKSAGCAEHWSRRWARQVAAAFDITART